MFGLGNGGGGMDNFRSAEIVSESNKFDATQYSFFGEPSASSGLELQGGLELGEALEDGFDAPLEELEDDAGLYHLAPPRVEDEDDGDLSLAAIFSDRTALEDSPSAAEAPQQHPFLLGNDVITTPARVHRPSSPSLRLTPGAPSSIRQDDTPAHTLRGVPDLSMLEAAQLQQAAAFTPPPANNPMQLQLLSHQGTPAAHSVGRVVGPTSAADLEAQMLAQAQGRTPGPRLWTGQQPDSGMHHQLHNPTRLGLHGTPQHAMQQQQQQYPHGAWRGDAPYQSPGGLMAYDQGMPFISPMQLPGKGVLSPFPGQMPDLEQSARQGMMPPAPPRTSPFPLPPSQHEQRSSFPMASPPPPQPPLYMSPPPPPRSMPHPPHPPSPPMLPPQGHGPGAPPQHTQHRYDAGPPPHSAYPGPPGHYQQPQPGAPQPLGYMQQQQQQQQQQQRGSPYPVRPQQMQLQRQPAQSPHQQPHQHQHQRNASPGHGPNPNPGHGPRRLRGGSLMSEDEVEHIMRIMYAAVHAGHPYSEDYYFQAFTNLHCSARNDAAFEPAALRDLAEGVAALDSSAAAKFVPLEGLGKMVYSNLRTPRMLLDFGSGVDKEDEAAGEGGRAARPLDQEPLLAARIMIEDCVNLLLDVDDIDRRFKAAMARAANAPGSGAAPLPSDAADLLQRRALLLAGIASSFRLPRRPAGADPAPAATAPTPGGPEHKLSDLVFRRIMALPKGRKLLARTLLVISPPLLPAAPAVAVQAVPNMDPLQLLWAALRNAGWLFGSSLTGLEAGAERALAEATAKVAAAVVQAVGKVQERSALVGCLEALSGGLRQGGGGAGPGCLPLIRTRRLADEAAGAEWLGDVVVRVMQRAEELGQGTVATVGEASDEQQQWEGLMAVVVEATAGHLQALGAVHAAASAAGSTEALAMVAALAAKPVVQAVSQQAADDGRSRLRTLALALVA